MSGLLRVLCLVACASTLAGCSTATKFGYNHLDWFAKREIGKYFDLTERQEAWFDPRFDALWRWHREEQLPVYADDLRALAEQARQPLTREQIKAAVEMIEGHVDRALERGTPETVTMLAMLDQNQVSSLLKRIDRDIREAEEKLADQDDRDRRKASAKRVREWMKDRYGRLSDAQEALIDDWAAEREHSSEAWVNHSRRWRSAFAAALDQRAETGFAQQAATLLFDDDALVPEPLQRERARNRERWLDLAASISAATTPRQREHLFEYISNFAQDFETLAAQPHD